MDLDLINTAQVLEIITILNRFEVNTGLVNSY